MHGLEAADAVFLDGALGAAGDHDVGTAGADHVEGHADGVGGGGAGGGDGEDGALGLEGDGDVAGALVGDEHGDGHGGEAAGALLEEGLVAGAVDFLAADAHAQDAAHALGVHALGRLGPDGLPGVRAGLGGLGEGGVAGVDPRLLGGGDGVLREAGDALGLLGVDVLADVEVADLAGDLDVQAGSVEALDGLDAATAGADAFPKGLHIIAQGRDATQTGDDDFLLVHGVFLSECHLVHSTVMPP